MNISRNKPLTIKECKIQASILLKSLRSNDPAKLKQAVKQLQRLPEFKGLSLAVLLQTNIKRKHALAVIALENHFKSWLDLKCQLPFIIGGFLNQWFANYAEAKAHLQSAGGFLLPYKNQYFICEANYIKQLGLDPADPEWQLINYDWVKPSDTSAWQRLYKKWSHINADA